MRSVVQQLGVILLQKTFIFAEVCKECNVTNTNTPRNIKTAIQNQNVYRTVTFIHNLQILISFTSGTNQTNQQD